jgi:hypothetical protein
VPKDWNPRLIYDASLTEHTQILVEESPDFAIDMAVMLWVITKRRWSGKYTDWCELPVAWFAKKSHCGFERVAKSIDRLISMNIIRPMSPERRPKHVMFYIYVKTKVTSHVDPETYDGLENESDRSTRIESESAVSAPEIEENTTPVVVNAPKRPVSVPVSKLAGEVVNINALPMTPVLHWNTVKMETRMVPGADAATFPKCGLCGGIMHPTEGRQGNCQWCYLCEAKQILKDCIRGGAFAYFGLKQMEEGYFINGQRQTIESLKVLLENASS